LAQGAVTFIRPGPRRRSWFDSTYLRVFPNLPEPHRRRFAAREITIRQDSIAKRSPAGLSRGGTAQDLRLNHRAEVIGGGLAGKYGDLLLLRLSRTAGGVAWIC